MRFFKFVAHKKALCSACTHCSTSLQSRRVNRCSCSHPQKARLPMSLSSVGMTTSCSTTQLRKASFPICMRRGGSHMHCNATQWAKVEESRAVISVLMRLTSTTFAIFTGPRPDVVKVMRQAQLLNACSTECAFRQCSWLFVRFVLKVTIASVRQLSKAYLPSCAPGARTLLSSVSHLTPTLPRNSTQQTLFVHGGHILVQRPDAAHSTP